MKIKKALYILSGVSLLTVLALTLLWGTLVGAAPSSAVQGTFEVTPAVVSPDETNVSTADRKITVTLTDKDLDTVAFVGNGPDKQLPDFDRVKTADNTVNFPPVGNGERILIPANVTSAFDTFTIALRANPVVQANPSADFTATGGTIGTDVFTPLGDRNGTGGVTAADIEVVIPTGSTVVAADITIEGLSAIAIARGLVKFTVNRSGLNGQVFDIRYATTTRQLTRAPKTFTQALDLLPTTIHTGESFTHSLGADVTLLAATGDEVITDDDVKVGTGDGVGNSLITSLSVTALASDNLSVTLRSNGVDGTVATGATANTVLNYFVDQKVTLTSAVAINGFINVALAGRVADTGDGGVITTADIFVVSANAGFVTHTGGASVGTGDTAEFTASPAALAAGSTFTLRYHVSRIITVPETGLFDSDSNPGAGDVPAGGEPLTLDLNIDWLPLQDTNEDGKVSTADLIVSIAGILGPNTPQVTDIRLTNQTLSTADGSPQGVTIALEHSGDALSLLDLQGASRKISVSYKGLEDLVTVRGANAASVPLRLRETGPDTGVFTAVVFVVRGDNDQPNVLGNTIACGILTCNLNPTTTTEGDRPTIAVIDGGAVNVAYEDRDPVGSVPARVQVESEPPTFQNTAPSDSAITNDLDTVLTTEISDTIAGVNSTSDLVTGTTTPKSIGLKLTVDTVPTEVSTADLTVTETPVGSGVFTVQYNINNIAKIKAAKTAGADITSTITWVFAAKDKAGNGTGSGIRTLKIVKVKPVLVAATAGDNWNPVTQRLEGSRVGVGKDNRTSIMVEFNQPVDPSSLETTDFTVDGVAPISVAHFTAVGTGVFLTVPLMAPGATPVVVLVGEIKDTGGNLLSSGTKTALDRIAPVVTASIVNNFTKGDIVLNVKSDEPIAGSRPNIEVRLCPTFTGSTTTGDCTVAAVHTTSTSIVVERAEWNFKLSGLAKGRYNIRGDASDVAVNKGTFGVADVTSTSALSFEIDKTLEKPTNVTASPEGSGTSVGKVILADPVIIKIDWSSEGNGDEYKGDTHAKVDLTKAELDGVSVLALASSKGGLKVEWTITVPKSTLGATEADQVKAHKLVFNGTDELGNTRTTDEIFDFTVIKKPAYELALTPGINLISLPSEPASSKIDDVITSKDEIDLVFTYDPTDPKGPWLVASRADASQAFQGDLKTIDAKHAYFVRAVSGVTLKVDLPTPDPTDLFIPPTISVQKGWNLIPVADIEQKTFAATIDADAYLAGTKWARALTFDPTKSPQWVTVAPDPALAPPANNLMVGFGYWVWFNEPGLIVP